jgi:hypothetical protein
LINSAKEIDQKVKIQSKQKAVVYTSTIRVFDELAQESLMSLHKISTLQKQMTSDVGDSESDSEVYYRYYVGMSTAESYSMIS